MSGIVAVTAPSLVFDLVQVVFALAGFVAACAGLYLVLLAFASFGRRSVEATPPRSRIAVLVPAHDEAALVGRCVTSLRQQSYPQDLYDIVVIADNCTDDTAARAAAAGATVLVRTAPDVRGKGPALRWAMDHMLESDPDLAALAVVDADSVADPGLLGALVARLEQGAPVVQAEYLGRDEDGSIRSELRAAAFLLFHRVRFGGRAAPRAAVPPGGQRDAVQPRGADRPPLGHVHERRGPRVLRRPQARRGAARLRR